MLKRFSNIFIFRKLNLNLLLLLVFSGIVCEIIMFGREGRGLFLVASGANSENSKRKSFTILKYNWSTSLSEK